MPTVVIVDDHPIVRAGMRMLCQAAGDIAVLAEGATGADALRLVDQHHPDVLVLDVNLPDISGVQVTHQLCARGVRTAILILTVHSDAPTISGLLESGATGYVLKDEALETLVSAVRAAARGGTWLSPAVANQVLHRTATPAPSDSPLRSLTPRELQVLSLLAQGCSNEAIAERLTITMRTVQNHVSIIYSKLGVASRTEAALIAIRQGLVEIPREGNA